MYVKDVVDATIRALRIKEKKKPEALRVGLEIKWFSRHSRLVGRSCSDPVEETGYILARLEEILRSPV